MSDEEDDDDWLDALAGRSGAESNALALEALLLRKFIQSQAPAITLDIPSADAKREQQLIERARSEELLSAPSPRRRWFVDARVKFTAAAMVIIAAGIGLWQLTLPPTETLRGTVNGIVHLEARDPATLKRQLTEELHALGVQVSGYERLGHIGIDAELPQPVPAPIAEILERHHIPVPTDGALTVEIDAPRR
jgi:hypothetical protein